MLTGINIAEYDFAVKHRGYSVKTDKLDTGLAMRSLPEPGLLIHIVNDHRQTYQHSILLISPLDVNGEDSSKS